MRVLFFAYSSHNIDLNLPAKFQADRMISLEVSVWPTNKQTNRMTQVQCRLPAVRFWWNFDKWNSPDSIGFHFYFQMQSRTVGWQMFSNRSCCYHLPSACLRWAPLTDYVYSTPCVISIIIQFTTFQSFIARAFVCCQLNPSFTFVSKVWPNYWTFLSTGMWMIFVVHFFALWLIGVCSMYENWNLKFKNKPKKKLWSNP